MIPPESITAALLADFAVTTPKIALLAITNALIANLDAGKINAGTLSSVTINGGAQFVDSLGTFYPIVINSGGDLTVNSSSNHMSSVTFHNTLSATPANVNLYYEAAANIPNYTVRLIPNPTNGTFNGLFIAKDAGAGGSTPLLRLGNLNGTGGNGTGTGISLYHTDTGVLTPRVNIYATEAIDAGGSENLSFDLYNGTTALTSMLIHRRGGLVDVDLAQGSKPATTDTRGFAYLPIVSGAPSGVPSNDNSSKGNAWVYDDTNHKIYVYSFTAAAWKKTVALT